MPKYPATRYMPYIGGQQTGQQRQQRPGEGRQAYIDSQTTIPKAPVALTPPPVVAKPPVEGPPLPPDTDPAGTAKWRTDMEAKEAERKRLEAGNSASPYKLETGRPGTSYKLRLPYKKLTPTPPLNVPPATGVPTGPPIKRIPRFSNDQ